MATEWHAKRIDGSTIRGDYCICGNGLIDPSKIATTVLHNAETLFDETPTWNTLFAYMFRRFGVPDVGDEDKQIGEWLISTPHRHVLLWVKPNPSGLLHSFGYGIPRSNRLCEKTIASYIETAVSDLLTCVCIRDVPINACGQQCYETADRLGSVDYARYSEGKGD